MVKSIGDKDCLCNMENEFNPEEIKKSDEYINKRLFGYMKDNDYWYTTPKTSKTCNFHNPLNGVAYGLCFHKEERWLQAVEAKLAYKYRLQGHEFFIKIRNLEPEEGEGVGYCLHAFTQRSPFSPPFAVGHAHGSTLFEARKLLLLDCVETSISKLN